MVRPLRGDKEERHLWERFKEGAAPAVRSPCPGANDLAAYLDGRASGKEARSIEEHLVSCPSCLEAVGELRALLREDVPAGVGERARGLVPAPGPPREGVLIRLAGRLDGLYPSVMPSAGWAAAAVLVLSASVAGITLGRVTFQNRRAKVASVIAELGFEGDGSPIGHETSRDFMNGGL